MSVEERYDKLATEAALRKVRKGKISPYTKKLYAACQSTGELKDISEIEFAARTSNWNPGKEGIGERAQIEELNANGINVKKLPTRNNKSGNPLFLSKNNNRLVIQETSKEAIRGIKSLDAYSPEYFFVFKTIDIGSFSKSMDGGHQGNVKTEIEQIVSNVQSEILYQDKPTKIAIIIDGRSALPIIEQMKKIANEKFIWIGTSEHYLNSHNGIIQ